MKTKILATALTFTLCAFVSASPSNTDKLTTVSDAQNISFIYTPIGTVSGRNKIASSHIISRHSISAVAKSTKESVNGRNVGLQFIALKDLKKTEEMQFAIQNF